VTLLADPQRRLVRIYLPPGPTPSRIGYEIALLEAFRSPDNGLLGPGICRYTIDA